MLGTANLNQFVAFSELLAFLSVFFAVWVWQMWPHPFLQFIFIKLVSSILFLQSCSSSSVCLFVSLCLYRMSFSLTGPLFMSTLCLCLSSLLSIWISLPGMQRNFSGRLQNICFTYLLQQECAGSTFRFNLYPVFKLENSLFGGCDVTLRSTASINTFQYIGTSGFMNVEKRETHEPNSTVKV